MSAEESSVPKASLGATEPDELAIANEYSNLSIKSRFDCSMCKDEICHKELLHPDDKLWKGENFELKSGQLKDPQHADRYPLLQKYIKNDKYVNLSKICENLADVLNYIQEPSTPYNELENLLTKVGKIEQALTNFERNKIFASIKASYNDDTNVTAPYSKEIKTFPCVQKDIISSSSISYIDCEYTVKVSIPSESAYSSFVENNIFKPKDPLVMNKYRWIFIPSSDRFDMKDVILDRSHFKIEGEILAGDTLCFVVVRGNQFDRYRERIGHRLPIIQLPENVIGVGYARFWIVKIAKRFQLEQIWMIDDSVSLFKENIPTKKDGCFEIDADACILGVNVRCPQYCFQKMETILKNQRNLVAISPRKHRGYINVRDEFTNKPVQSVMLLNIQKITDANINFRPELRYMEDMIFSKECTNAGFIVCIWNAIIFMDQTQGEFKTTGANTTSQTHK